MSFGTDIDLVDMILLLDSSLCQSLLTVLASICVEIIHGCRQLLMIKASIKINS